jgi:O-antigen/teichoic acid export membrane protein
MSVVTLVGRGVALNSAATVIGKVVMFANVFITLHFLTVYEYGFSELVMSIISMVGIVLLPGLTSTIVADMGVERGRNNVVGMKTVFHQFILLNFLLGIGAWFVLFFGSHPIANIFGNPYAAQFLQIASFLFLITPLRSASTILASVMLRFFDQAFYGIFEEVTKLLLLLTFIVWMDMGIQGLIYAMVLCQLVVVVLFLPRTISAYRFFSGASSVDHLHFWRVIQDHRMWGIGTAYTAAITQNVRLWLIKFLLGTEAVGIFAFASGLFSHIASLMPLSSVLAPIIPRYVDKHEQLARIVRASIKVQLVLAGTFLLGAYVTSYLFVLALFPKYLAAVPLLYVLLLTIIPNSVMSIFTPVFNAFKQQRSLLYSKLLQLVCLIVLLPPSIFVFGLNGVGVEIFLNALINGFERHRRIKRLIPNFRFGSREIFHTDEYEKEAFATVVRTFVEKLPRVIRSIVDPATRM